MSIVFLLVVPLIQTMADAPLPNIDKETLSVAGNAAVAVLSTVSQPQCSVVLFTDGNTSAVTIRESVVVRNPWGSSVLEVTVNGQDAHVLGRQLFPVVGDALRVRQLSWCMTVVVVSDDPAFLAAFMESSLKNLLLVWSTKLLVVTRLSLPQLQHLHTSFSMTNTVLLVVDDNHGHLECHAYVHLPYSPTGTQPLQVASWTSAKGLTHISSRRLFPDKFDALLHRPFLIVAAEVYLPHIELFKEDGVTSPTQLFQGPMVNLLEILANTMNFTYKYARPADGSWGGKLRNGSWTGMVGMLDRKEADIGLGPFGVSVTRAQVVDFTQPILIDYARILGGRGRPEVDPWGFLLPLTPLVWATILTAVLLVMPLTVFLLSSCSGLKTTSKSLWSSDVFFTYIRVTLQQDNPVPPDLWWERLVLGVWMMMTLVLTRSYAGNLMSLLAVRHIPQPYHTLRDVLDDPTVTMLWEGNNAYVQYYRSVNSGIFREIADSENVGRIQYVRSTQFPASMETLVRQGSHVLIAEDLYGRVLMAQDFSRTGHCDFYASREVFLPFMFAMVGQKNSPLVPVISGRIESLRESGIYDHWMETAIPNSTSCVYSPTKITVNTSLSLYNLWGMFAVVCAGMVVSVLALTCELLGGELHQFWGSTGHDP
ncbi:LOW QUALITY PROTEIN: probable glutamate receptor [Panulirus ornatus]|uniref:LOW QUALITY PROTEIN: probable glutamate receptor n=1 Tax=Panulirus ornatus TaxID=150431 RepID=UPI003A89CB27